MNSDRQGLVLWGALIASILLHAFLLLPGLLVAATAEAGYTEFEHELEDDMKEREKEEMERLGLKDSNISSMTWIGYDTYQEHLAQLSEFEQAQFEEASSTDESQVESDLDAPAPNPGTPATVGGQQSPQQAQTNTPKGGSPPIDGAGSTGGGIPTKGQGPLADAPTGAAEDTGTEPGKTPGKKEPKPTPTTAPGAPEQPGEKPASGGGAPKTPPSDSPNPPKPDASDKQSDATSNIEVPLENWNNGRPLSAAGLEMFPKRPVLTSLQLLSGTRNMLVVIHFPDNGKPTKAEILEGSGNASIDAAVLASLYRWRAKGKRLETLGKNETVNIRLELMWKKRR